MQRQAERVKNEEEYGLKWPYTPKNVAAAKEKAGAKWPYGDKVEDASLWSLLTYVTFVLLASCIVDQFCLKKTSGKRHADVHSVVG